MMENSSNLLFFDFHFPLFILSNIRCLFLKSMFSTDALIAFMDSKLGYLKIVTAKRPKEKLFGVDDVSENGSLSSKAMNELKKSSGKQRFVMINGKLVESDAKEVPRALRTSVDPDDLARHNHLLQRQYFMHRK